MGRSVLADECIQQYIEQLIKTGQWYTGLVIGQQTAAGKDYIVRLVRTPDPVEDEASEEEDGEEVEPRRQRSESGRPGSLELADEKWAATHTKQVIRMLPGGLDIIGIFALAPPDMMSNAQTRLRQILFAVHKNLSKNLLATRDDEVTDRLVLQICSVTRKVTCRTFDVADNKSSARPAEWRYQSHLDRWTRLSTRLAINISIPITEKIKTHVMLKQIQLGISSFCTSLSKARMLIDNVVRDPSETLEQSETRKGKGKDRSSSAPQNLNVVVLVPLSTDDSGEPSVSKLKSLIAIKGQVVGRAFVNFRATVADATEALKTDIVRSLTSRCELLCEDIDVIEADSSKELYNTPVRVFAHLPASTLHFSDYMFQDEKTSEVVDRFKELLDIDVEEKDIEFHCERPGAESDWLEQTSSEDTLLTVGGITEKNTFKYYVGAVVAGLVAMVTALLYVYVSAS
ncbi:protein odr-4 homolog [Gigantopelta aegis]|uniref:protein odr-4 homolog n=1 Tax=Gigantopelta aegis TaxID=1735272 RepID=UPI001B88D3A2|nr:protein odr-4 homolog [Gigantopelta aegis]